ncbi:MAG: hypothetical protein RSG52_10220 [Terrisporobacter sp.]
MSEANFLFDNVVSDSPSSSACCSLPLPLSVSSLLLGTAPSPASVLDTN